MNISITQNTDGKWYISVSGPLADKTQLQSLFTIATQIANTITLPVAPATPAA